MRKWCMDIILNIIMLFFSSSWDERRENEKNGEKKIQNDFDEKWTVHLS